MFCKEVSIDYDFNFMYDVNWNNYEHSCIAYPDGNLPKTFTHHNTLCYQKFFNREELDFKNLGDQVGVEAIYISMIKQPPGMVNPLHRDTFYRINKLFPDDPRLKVRANIQLLDWKTGHFLQFNDTVVTHWKANTGHMWDSSVFHLAANAGLEDRFSLQISGFLIE